MNNPSPARSPMLKCALILMALFLQLPSRSFSIHRTDLTNLPLKVSEDRRIACWREYLSRQEADGFSGAVLIAAGDKVLLNKEYGSAAKDGKSTAFWVASISKTITATAILKLADDGLLDLHAPLSRYLPGVPTELAGITIHHLLSHRSGLPHAYAADGIVDRDAATKAILEQKLRRKTGEFGYSNDGYNLLAILIEIVSRESFEKYARRQVLQPAGMKSAGFWGFEPEGTPMASLMNPAPGSIGKTVWLQGRSVANWGYRGATGVYATPQDLFRFARALESGQLLKRKTFADMVSSKERSFEPDADTYGYGWQLRFKNGRLTQYWHTGNEDWLGHNGVLKVIDDRIFIVLSNAGRHKERSWAGYVEAGLHTCEPTAVGKR